MNTNHPVSHRNKKKAITPLIATFLLISFAVALGVVIMNFGRAEVEAGAQCPMNLEMRLLQISGEEQLCYDAAKKELLFTVENGINMNVEGVMVSVVGSQQSQNFEFNQAKMGKAGTYVGHISYDTSVSGGIKQVKISPKLILQEQEQVCADQAVIVEQIKACSGVEKVC
ncbi:MAG: hypothetical protein AABY26_06515 [Nanoarchaeota archaeon]